MKSFRSVIDSSFKWVSLSIGMLWTLQAIADIILSGNLFTVTRILPFNYLHSEICAHSATIPLLFALYVYSYNCLRSLHGMLRTTVSVTFVMLGINYNAVFWSLGDELINGTGAPLMNICFFLLTVLLLVVVNLFYNILNIRYARLMILTTFAVIIWFAFYNSGFYEAWYLHSKIGGYPDPHDLLWWIRGATGLLIPTALVGDGILKRLNKREVIQQTTK